MSGLSFSEKKVVGTVEIPLQIKETDIENIIVCSFEGGSNYWLGLSNDCADWDDKPKGEPNSMWATKLILEGKTVRFYDVEEEEEDTTEWYLTLPRLLEGIKLNALKRPWASDKDNWDAGDADCIVQYAMFGEVVYG